MVSEADAELAVPSAPHTANGQNDASDRSDARLPVDPHDHEALKKELESVYAGAEVADLKHAMGLARYEYETLRQQAMSEQVAMGKYNRAAQIDAGFTPKEILDQRPKVRYSHQVSLNPGSMEPPEEGIWVVEYYVREDEYPDVYRAFDEWNWLKRQIKKLEGETR